MSGIMQRTKEEWRRFKREEPGKRFIAHYQRAQKNKSAAKTALRIAVGILLLAGGVFLWFVPGPGWLFVFFGLAMFAGESRALASFLDKVELRLRAWFVWAKRFWRRAHAGVKAAIAGVALTILCGVCYGAWIILFK
jgi:hypothetical protein